MTKKTDKTANIKASKSKSAKSTEKPALAWAPNPDRTTTTSRLPRKQQLLDMLARKNGARSSEMIAMTGWLPHTLRAALSGLRKQGHVIERIKVEDGSSLYRITGGEK